MKAALGGRKPIAMAKHPVPHLTRLAMPTADSNSTASAAILVPKDLPPPVPHEWHWPEYGAELAGTVWNVFIGLSAVVFNFAPGMPGARWVPNAGLRLWVTGLIFAGSGSLFTISPWRRLSGAQSTRA